MKRKPLAEKVGRDTKVAADIEAGQRLPTLATVARLASALGVAAAWLAYGIGDMHTDHAPALTDGMGARLVAVRSEREVSKAELARLTELSPRAIAKIEAGGQAGIETIEALAKALDISPAWLAFNQGPRELPKRRRSAKSPAPSTPTHP